MMPRRSPRPGRGGERGPRQPAWRVALLLLVAAFVWVEMPASALVAAVPPALRAAPRDGLPWLRTDAGAIVDSSGRRVLLRGFNSDALLEPAARHAPLDDTDADLMARAGFDLVRLPIAWALLEPERGRVDAAELDRIAATVAMLNRHGLYVVLDMHVLDWSTAYDGSGAPAWADGPAVLDTCWTPWRLLCSHLNPAQNAATTYFWVSTDWQRDFGMVWRAVASRFRDDSGVAGYDLYNEPHPLPLPPRVFEREYMWPLYQRTVESIGAVDPNHLFIVEGTFFGNEGTDVRPLAAPDLVYSPHLYTGSLVPPSFDDGNPGPIRQRVAEQSDEAARVPAPLWSGEVGIDRSMPNSAAWADAALGALDDAAAGWAWWQWRESPQWGIRTADGAGLDLAYLRHLARPYLVAAPPGTTAGHGDGTTGRLAVRVPAGTRAELIVGWPELTVSGVPQASGACVTAVSPAPGTGRLRIGVEAAAECAVSVGPGA